MTAIVFVQHTAGEAELLMLAGAVSQRNYETVRKLLATKPEPRP